MPDTLVTLSTLEKFLLDIQKQAYQQGQADMQAKVDSLQQAISVTSSLHWPELVLGYFIGTAIAAVIVFLSAWIERKQNAP